MAVATSAQAKQRVRPRAKRTPAPRNTKDPTGAALTPAGSIRPGDLVQQAPDSVFVEVVSVDERQSVVWLELKSHGRARVPKSTELPVKRGVKAMTPGQRAERADELVPGLRGKAREEWIATGRGIREQSEQARLDRERKQATAHAETRSRAQKRAGNQPPRPAQPGQSGLDAIATALEQAGRPVHTEVLTAAVLKHLGPDRATYNGLTPAATIASQLAVANKDHRGRFVRVAPGCYALRAWPAEKRRLAPTRPKRLA